MSIKAVCPTCANIYQVGENLLGKKIRCKNCQAVFVAELNPKVQIEDEEPVDVEPEETNKDKKTPNHGRSKSKRNSKSKKPTTSWFLGVIFASIVLVGGGGTLWFIAKNQIKNKTIDADGQLNTELDQTESTKNQVANASDPELEKSLLNWIRKNQAGELKNLKPNAKFSHQRKTPL